MPVLPVALPSLSLTLSVAVSTGVALGCGASALVAAPPVEASAAVPNGPFEGLDGTGPVMPALIARYSADRRLLDRFHDAPISEAARARRRAFLDAWDAALDDVEFGALDADGRVDWVLLRNALAGARDALEYEAQREAEIAGLLPFAPVIVHLHEARRDVEPIDPAALAEVVTDLAGTAEAARTAIDAMSSEDRPAPSEARRAALMLDRLRRTLRAWHDFYDGYDPIFSWWLEAPYAEAEKALRDYGAALRTKGAGMTGDDDADTIIGDPIGDARLRELLALEFIPYTPAELIEIAEREFDWCRAERAKAARELGFGEDWQAALNHVKGLHVEPGAQPAMIKMLADEAVAFLRARDLVTIPDLAVEAWRMEMMSPARQKISPYFLGGETIMVSFPTDTMAHADKLMSMRGNNLHFARATVHHELIPGHHLQGFMTRRYRPYRSEFGTPFWGEGWALYWEMQLWDLGFPQSPEDRMGMLFWRSHRCARIIFSLSFHLGTMSPEECIDFLVENVGHERNNATAEVRRSVSGDYGPLYQAAYMLGGLQIRSLHDELVGSGRMTDRAFHDAVLQQNSIPIELIRARLSGQPPARDFATTWRF